MTPEEELFNFKKKQAAASINARKQRAAPPAAPAPQTPEEIVAAAVPTREQMAEAASAQGQPMTDILTLFQRGAAYGQSPNMAGAASAAAGGSFEEGRQQMLEQERQASENLTAMGIPFGAIPEAAGGVMTGAAIAKPLAAAIPAIQGWLGTLLMGGAEGNIYGQGQDLDPVTSTLTGIGGAGLARSLATGLSKLGDMLPNLSVQQNAAKEIQKQAENAGIAPEDFIPTIQSEIDRLGPSGTLADIEMLRPKAVGSVSEYSSPKAMADAFGTATAQSRNVSDLAAEEWERLFPVPRTVNERGEAKKLTLDEAKTIYDAGLNSTKVRFRPAPINNIVEQAFGTTPIDSAKTAKRQILSFIKTKSPLGGPDGKTPQNIEARDLLSIKKAVDKRIGEIARGAPDPDTYTALSKVSAQINKMIKDNVPEVRDAAEIYSGQYAQDVGFDAGYELGKSGLKNQSLADFRELTNGFTASQKTAFAEGWRKAKYEAADKKGVEKEFLRVGPTKSAADLEIIDQIFGPDTGKKFADVSRRITAVQKTNDQLLNEWKSVTKATAKPRGPSLNKIGQVIDLVTIATQAAQNKLLSGATQGATRREATAVGRAAESARGDQALNWLTRTGTTPQTTEEAMQEIQRYLALSRPSPLPQNLAAQAGRVGAAFERSGR